MKQKIFRTIVLIVVFISISSSVAFAAAKTLSVTSVTQEMSNWCWAACDEMSGKFYYNYNTGVSSSRDQEDVVVHTYGSAVNYCGTLAQTRDGQEWVAYNSSLCNSYYQNYGKSYSSVKYHIDLNKPIIAVIEHSGGAHAVVVYGYADGGWFTEDRIRYIDPINGSMNLVDYDDFPTHVIYGGEWNYSVLWYNN